MKSSLAVLLASFALSAGAIAQESPEPQLPAFDEVDQNKDGMIDQTEAAAVEGLDFAAADTNKDGQIDHQEYNRLMS